MCYVGTVNHDGSPHVVPTWVDEADGLVLINSIAGRVWTSNLARDPRVSCLVHNVADPQEYALVSGTLSRTDDEDAEAHFASLAERYLGVSGLKPNPGEHRIVYRIEPHRVIHQRPRHQDA
jgi:PPOX class probable F420-dependent enzyme